MTAMAHLSRRYSFSASHRLHVEEFSAQKNREVYGKCNNPHGHGHNYVLEVSLRGPVDAATGMVTDLAQLDSFVQQQILDAYDHANLNTLPAFAAVVPSTENLCVEFWRLCSGYSSADGTLRLERIRVEETGNNSFDYSGPTVSGTPTLNF